MYKDVVGKKSKRIKNYVERGWVKRFAESIGDLHPLYIDEETGKNSKYGNNIAPPTYPRTFDFGLIPGLNLPEKGLIHGEQTYHYNRPLLVGETVYCYTGVEDYFEKTGNNGLMGFLVTKRYGEDIKGNVIFIEGSTVIITEAVREAMKV
ncbi:MaoC family dehydratase N-terminal domain-containing protein [Oceanobacillus sp. HCA-5259]|uniref:MaoC family dehydratase N-terminal domain-containing protein n=1 Tax=Oceanobacillus sp. HCA-5259 TaxID=3134661 RepID=UPI0030BAD9DE